MNGIRHLKRKEIDTSKWDACIAASPNGLIYSYSLYLDAMATNWDGLVLNDYEAVMPLTWRRKGWIYYLYQPLLTAQTGITGPKINEEIVRLFLASVPKSFRYWDIYLNNSNGYALKDFPMQWRNNLVLSLASSYDQLWSSYRKNTQRNTTKAKGYGCYAKKDVPVREVLALAQAYTPGLAGHANELSRFEQLFQTLREKGSAVTYGCFSADHQLLSAAVFLFSNGRSYYILAGNHPNGKTLGASHLLIDRFIADHAGQDLLLDFEGSDLPSLAFFYTGFGGTEERYPVILLNRLPFYARWLKS
ncbi:MAG TPA: hypothetical protein VGB56_10395 [Flavisolibacter sp.]